MADDIEFRLKTTGDPSGAEVVEKSIFKASDAAEEAQRKADVAAVETKRAAEEAIELEKRQAESLAQVAEATQRIVAANLAKTIGDVAGQFKGLGPEVDLAVEGGQRFLEVFASTGDPIKAALALTATAIGGVVTAYREAREQSKQIAKDEEENLKKIQEIRRAYYQEVRTQGLVAFFDEELKSLDEQEAALRRIYQLKASQRDLDAATRTLANVDAGRGGADPTAVAAANLSGQTNDRVAALNDELAKARAALETANTKASDLKLKANALVEQQGEGGTEALAAVAAAKEAAEAATKSQLDFATFEKVTQTRIQQAYVEAETSGRQISDEGGKRLAEVALKEVEAITAAADRSGKAISVQGQASIAILTRLAADGIIKPEELAELQQTLTRVSSSRESADKAVADGLKELIALNGTFTQVVQPMLGQISQLKRDVEDLRVKAGDL